MRKSATYFICFILCMMISASCIDRPDYVLDEDQMVDLLVDVHKAEGLLETQASTNNDQEYMKAVMAAVLVEHGVSRAQYDSSLMWYARHLKELVRVYSHVDERLLDEYDKWSALSTDSRDFATSESGDSVQLWNMRNYLVLDKSRFVGKRFWELESDTNFRRGDTLRWTFDVDHLTGDQQLLASISFSRDNKEWQGVNTDASIRELRKTLPAGQSVKLIDKNGPQVISAVPDSMQRFEKAFISIMLLAPEPDTIQSPVFLNHISLIRYHCE